MKKSKVTSSKITNETNGLARSAQNLQALPLGSDCKAWTLFLDRDGVINQEVNKNYITHVEDFHFISGSLQAIVALSKLFQFVIIVTNQKGVGMGKMSLEDLKKVHQHMEKKIKKQGGHLSLILASTDVSQDAFMRKPNTGMAHQAKKKLPNIQFEKSIMVGNSHSDILFGRNAGMKTIFVTTNKQLAEHQKEDADFIIPNLKALEKIVS